MKITYVATTNSLDIPKNHQIFMVDGTVPNWIPSDCDGHWDHHRQGGADIQVDEMPIPEGEFSLLKTLSVSNVAGQVLVTTQIDADACCSAAWLQLSEDQLNAPVKSQKKCSVIDCFRAISYDCDHLSVSSDLSHLSDFAAQAVAAMKQDGEKIIASLGFSKDRRSWTTAQRTEYSSLAFERGTKWLIDAALGIRQWPGEAGEAVDYWKQVEEDTQTLFECGRIKIISGVALCDARGFGRHIDPRSFVRAIQKHILPSTELRPQKLTIKDHGTDGYRYTLDCIPHHAKKNKIDYTKGTISKLTQAEKEKAGESDVDCQWGGRKTVAGSAWNAPSHLEPVEVIDLLEVA